MYERENEMGIESRVVCARNEQMLESIIDHKL